MDGISAIEELRNRTAQSPVVIMTAFGDLETAVSAVEQGLIIGVLFKGPSYPLGTD